MYKHFDNLWQLTWFFIYVKLESRSVGCISCQSKSFFSNPLGKKIQFLLVTLSRNAFWPNKENYIFRSQKLKYVLAHIQEFALHSNLPFTLQVFFHRSWKFSRRRPRDILGAKETNWCINVCANNEMLSRVFSRNVRAIDVVELSSKLELNIVRLAH